MKVQMSSVPQTVHIPNNFSGTSGVIDFSAFRSARSANSDSSTSFHSSSTGGGGDPLFSSLLHGLAAPWILVALGMELVSGWVRQRADDKLDAGEILDESELWWTDNSSWANKFMALASMFRGIMDASPTVVLAYLAFVILGQEDIDSTKVLNHIRQDRNVLLRDMRGYVDGLDDDDLGSIKDLIDSIGIDNLNIVIHQIIDEIGDTDDPELQEMKQKLEELQAEFVEVSGWNGLCRWAFLALCMAATYFLFTRSTDVPHLQHERPQGENWREFLTDWMKKFPINTKRELEAAAVYTGEAFYLDKRDEEGYKAWGRWLRDIKGDNPEYERKLKEQLGEHNNKVFRGVLRFAHPFSMRTLTITQALFRLGGALTLLYAAKNGGNGIITHGSRYEDPMYEQQLQEEDPEGYAKAIGALNIASQWFYPAGTVIAGLTAASCNNPVYLNKNGILSLGLRDISAFVLYPLLALCDMFHWIGLRGVLGTVNSGVLQASWAATGFQQLVDTLRRR